MGHRRVSGLVEERGGRRVPGLAALFLSFLEMP